MKAIGALLVVLAIAACSGGGPAGSSGPTATPQQTSSPTVSATSPPTPGVTASAATGGGNVIDAAKAAAAHTCAILTADQIKTFAGNAPAPSEELYPPRCSVFGDKAAIGWFLNVINPPDPMPSDGTPVSGFSTTAYVQELAKGNWTLSVALTPDFGSISVEVNYSDSNDHLADAVTLAKAILAKLGA